jgi:peroxiredoxin
VCRTGAVAYRREHERDIQAAIGLTLATYLKMTRESYDESLMLISYGQRGRVGEGHLENVNRWKELGVDKLSHEAEQLFETLIADYGDVKLKDSYPENVAEVARQQLHDLRNLQIGNLAPGFEAKDVDGNPIKLTDLRGKVVVLDFGSHSKCGICSALYPDLRNLVEQFKDQPFELIGINLGDEPEKLRELTHSQKVTWKIIWDGNDWGGPISSNWAIDSMPTFYVIDHKGIIRGKNYHGVFQVMPALIEKLLADRKAEQAAREQPRGE